ncbi:MAG: cobyrinate a,c-diamide synthase, partial [Desulfobacterales bacterium]
MAFSRIIIAALRGGSGKTILSIGLIATFRNLGKSIAPFKKGPDYIDAGWLALAAGRPCYNLDSFLLSSNQNVQSFLSHSIDCDISIIEGNRGLYDGIDLEGSTSTAELAKLLKCPVILCVDCTKITRTMAAVVSGCAMFDPEVDIKGIILNRVANARHEEKLRDSIEHYCGISVLGAIPKLGEQYFPERHLGLVPSPEHDWARDSIDAISEIVDRYIDLETIAAIAGNAPDLKAKDRGQRAEEGGLKTKWGNRKAEVEKPPRVIRDPHPEARDSQKESGNHGPGITIDDQAPRIGIIRDSAFQFYYPENIDVLVACGAKITFVSPLRDQHLPELDAL